MLIMQYGPEAKAEANKRLEHFLAANDAKASAAWLGICQALDDLETTQHSGRLH
jgi:hypothetical protein